MGRDYERMKAAVAGRINEVVQNCSGNGNAQGLALGKHGVVPDGCSGLAGHDNAGRP